MKVKVLDRFYDLQSKTLRLKGDEFTVSKERYEELVSASSRVLIEVVEEKPKRSKKAVSESGE